jgi:hypothetical protein
MAQLSIPSEAPIYNTNYEQLYGVDYRRDVTSVDKAHSPNMVNMISDFGGNPVKRAGYRKLSNTSYDEIIAVSGDAYGVRKSSASQTLYVDKLDISGYPNATSFVTEWTQDIQGSFGNINGAYAYQQKIFILLNNGVVKFDTTTRTFLVAGVGTGMMSETGLGSSKPKNPDIVPTTVIGLKPNGTGGVTLDDINLMSIYQTQSFGGDGSTKEYVIAGYEYIGNWAKVEILDLATGEWNELDSGYELGTAQTYTAKILDGSTTASFTVRGAKIKFTNAPASVEGQSYTDNVRITFAPFSTASAGTGIVQGFYSEQRVKLLSSKVSCYYDNRLFIADGAKAYYSDINEPFVISDLHWFEVDNTIMCFTRSSSYLAIITKDDGKNTVFLASQTTVSTSSSDDDTNASDYAYSVKASNAGAGAVSNKVDGVFNDEPVFLSSTGLHALLTNYQSEKYAVNRSGKINRQLCAEKNLENAVGIPFNGYYYIAINAKMYVLDSRNKESNSRGDKSYECYFFDGMPTIKNMFVVNNKMFFSDNQATYGWNDDLPETAKYYDDAHIGTDGAWTGTPVKAKWCSAFDDDKHPEKLKTLLKKGCLITLMPHYRSGCEVTLVKNGNVFQRLGYVATDMFTFENISFKYVEDSQERSHPFSFKSSESASDVFIQKKIKKYKRLQIIVENNEPEPFGIICIVKSYTFGSYAKR